MTDCPMMLERIEDGSANMNIACPRCAVSSRDRCNTGLIGEL